MIPHAHTPKFEDVDTMICECVLQSMPCTDGTCP